MLVNAIIIPINAYLLERFSIRKLFTAPMIIYICGCVLMSVGPNFITVLIGRICQALAAGVITPTTIAYMYIIYPKEKRGSAAGFYGIITGIAPAFAPAISGYVITLIN